MRNSHGMAPRGRPAAGLAAPARTVPTRPGAQAWLRLLSPAWVVIRVISIPLLLLALWSHHWWGTALSIAASALVCGLMFLGFLAGHKIRLPLRWAERAAFGERIWLNRIAVPLPEEAVKPILILNLVAALGTFTALVGVATDAGLLVLSGAVIGLSAKTVALDRLAALYDNMRTRHPLYRFWSCQPVNDNVHKAA